MPLFSIRFFIFLVITFILYYTLPKRFQWMVLLSSSIVFYYLGGGLKAGVFITTTILTTFYGARRMDDIAAAHAAALKNADKPLDREAKKALKAKMMDRKKRVLRLVLLLNFGILAVLKYSSFVVGNVNAVAGRIAPGFAIPQPRFLLPLGISFYTFQTMGYLIDVYRGTVKADRNLFQFALFGSYFPQILQGPIGQYGALAPQLYAEHTFDPVRFRKGFLRILWGYFKYVVIAERAGILVKAIVDGFDAGNYRGLTVFLGVFFYGIQMYGDFSGGIDIVLGVSDLFGITMMENFIQPFMARSVSEFWQRWHESLGHWMETYIFYPVALSKTFSKMQKFLRAKIGPYYGKTLPTCLASVIVFLTVGIWHGAAWKYVCFGLYHGILVSADTLFAKQFESSRKFLHIDVDSFSWRLFQMIRTTFLITIGRYFDCAISAGTAFRMLLTTFRDFDPGVLFDGSLLTLGLDGRQFLILLFTLLILLTVDIINYRGTICRDVFAVQGIVFRWLLYLAAIFVIMRFGVYGPGFDVSTFIYQGF